MGACASRSELDSLRHDVVALRTRVEATEAFICDSPGGMEALEKFSTVKKTEEEREKESMAMIKHAHDEDLDSRVSLDARSTSEYALQRLSGQITGTFKFQLNNATNANVYYIIAARQKNVKSGADFKLVTQEIEEAAAKPQHDALGAGRAREIMVEAHHVYLTVYTHDATTGEYRIHRQDLLIDAAAVAVYSIQPYHLKLSVETVILNPWKAYRISVGGGGTPQAV